MIKISKVYNKYYIIQYFRTFLNISQCHHFAKIPQIFQNGNNLQCEIFISHSSKTLRYNTRMKLFYRKASGPISDKVVVSLPGLREQDLTRLGPKSNSHQRCPSLMMMMMIMTLMTTMMIRRKGTWTQVKPPQALSRFVVWLFKFFFNNSRSSYT